MMRSAAQAEALPRPLEEAAVALLIWPVPGALRMLMRQMPIGQMSASYVAQREKRGSSSTQ